jgi:hypothetical protein
MSNRIDERWTLSRRIQLDPGEQGEGGVLFDSRDASLARCNDTAWTLLSLLRNGATLAELRDALADEFQVTAEAADHDVQQFLRQLHGMGWIEENTVERGQATAGNCTRAGADG